MPIQGQFRTGIWMGILARIWFRLFSRHGNGKVFSCKGILICLNYFLKRGHEEITVFLPQWRKCRPHYPHVMTDRHILDKLEREGYLVYTPSRRIGSKLVASYDDRYVVHVIAISSPGLLFTVFDLM